MTSPLEHTKYYYHNYEYPAHGSQQQSSSSASSSPPMQPLTSQPLTLQPLQHIATQPPPPITPQIFQHSQYMYSSQHSYHQDQQTISNPGYRHTVSTVSPVLHSRISPSMTPPHMHATPLVHIKPSSEAIQYTNQHRLHQSNEDADMEKSHTYTPLQTRPRRRSAPKQISDVKYPMNYPAHLIPPEMQVATGPNNGFKVLPPRPDDIRTRRYASGVDERNFFTVLEYEINSQPIIWDYYTGYVHLTGIWKAVGNSKADIVKLLDNSPELEPVIKRVRGGFLKIQGTWIPYDIARRLAAHVCYHIRFALVPLFGPDFPSQCTHPDEFGFGMLQLNMPSKNSEQPKVTTSLSPPARRIAPLQASAASPASNHGLSSSYRGDPVSSHSSSYGNGHNLGSHGHGRRHNSHGHHIRRMSTETGFKRRSSNRARTNSMPTAFLRRDSVRHALPVSHDHSTEIFDDNVFEDEDADADCVSPPPLPRKVSFTGEQTVSGRPSEFLAMLKATRSLQQMSTGRPVKDVGGGFECGGRLFMWDGSDRLDIIPSHSVEKDDHLKGISPARGNEPPKPEPTPPPTEHDNDRRLPSLAKILNI